MNILGPKLRRVACAAAVVGAGVSFATLLAEVGNALPAGTQPAGSITMTPASGDSGTTFALSFAAPPQFCPGDNTASYTWGTFLTPITNDPAPMTFTVSGSPIGAPAVSTVSLRNPAGTQLRALIPGLGDGLIVAPPSVSFQSIAFATLPAGDYWIGIACVLPDAGGVVQNTRFWAKAITITSTAGAGPNNFTFAAATPPTTTTTTTTSSTTTTTLPGATTTTTTTTTAGSSTTSTTTTTAGSSTTSTTVFRAVASSAGGSSSSGSGSGAVLANTGSSPTRILVWAILLITFGRMAVLLGRPLKVLPAVRS